MKKLIIVATLACQHIFISASALPLYELKIDPIYNHDCVLSSIPTVSLSTLGKSKVREIFHTLALYAPAPSHVPQHITIKDKIEWHTQALQILYKLKKPLENISDIDLICYIISLIKANILKLIIQNASQTTDTTGLEPEDINAFLNYNPNPDIDIPLSEDEKQLLLET